MNTITVPICLGYDREKVIGSVTIDPDALPTTDMVLAVGGKVLAQEDGTIKRWELTMFAPIPVMQHSDVGDLKDLLTSARAIAERKGEGTAWQRFSDRIASFGIGCITPRTFRILRSDLETEPGGEG